MARYHRCRLNEELVDGEDDRAHMGVVIDISHRVWCCDFGRKIAGRRSAAVLASCPTSTRLTLGEEDEALSIRRNPGARGDRGIMDYAAALHMPIPIEAVFRLNGPGTWRRHRAARKDFRLCALHLE